MSSKKQKIYFISNNGIKIEMNALNAASIYTLEQIRNKVATELRVPEDMLFPTGVMALTDKSKLEGELDVQV